MLLRITSVGCAVSTGRFNPIEQRVAPIGANDVAEELPQEADIRVLSNYWCRDRGDCRRKNHYMRSGQCLLGPISHILQA
jgi:hypothetical protein